MSKYMESLPTSQDILVLQTLSVYLQSHLELSPQEYVRRHPGGALGQLREGE